MSTISNQGIQNYLGRNVGVKYFYPVQIKICENISQPILIFFDNPPKLIAANFSKPSIIFTKKLKNLSKFLEK